MCLEIGNSCSRVIYGAPIRDLWMWLYKQYLIVVSVASNNCLKLLCNKLFLSLVLIFLVFLDNFAQASSPTKETSN